MKRREFMRRGLFGLLAAPFAKAAVSESEVVVNKTPSVGFTETSDYIQTSTFTVSEGTISTGQVVLGGTGVDPIIGVACENGKAGDTITVAINGVYDVETHAQGGD